MTPAEITNYFTTNPTVVTLAEHRTTTSVNNNAKIHHGCNGSVEAYNDYRRTGYPVLALVNNAWAIIRDVIPTRVATPAELASNPSAPKPRTLKPMSNFGC
jgi:hypothetical protein